MMLSLVSCHCGSFFTLSTCCPLAVGEMLENFPENICTSPLVGGGRWTSERTGTGCRRLWSKLKQNFGLKQKTETKKKKRRNVLSSFLQQAANNTFVFATTVPVPLPLPLQCRCSVSTACGKSFQ